MTNQTPQQPIFILSQDSSRTTGRDAQRNNIYAAKLVAETIRTTLGPKGMDKMLVDSMGDIIVTNDGVTILNEIQIEHPAAKMIVEVAKTQENEIGDGTTTAVIIAGELLKNAESLLEKEIHPTIIAKGYRIAAEKSHEILENLSEDITYKDTSKLKQIAITAMTGKGAESSKEMLADLTVKAIQQIATFQDEKITIDKGDLKLEKKTGAGIKDSELIYGTVIDKERAHPSMPKKVENAKIALIDSSLEIKNTEIDSKIQITDPSQLRSFSDMEESIIREMVEKISNSGATAVFCQKGIDDLAQHFLAKKGIYACRRVKKSDLESLSKSTGAKIITQLDDLSPSDLGKAELVEEQKVGDEEMTYVKGSKKSKSLTFLIRGGTQHVVDEVERAVNDAIGDVIATINSGKFVAGAGAVEIELSSELRKYANSLSGREQLAVLSFADSIEVIPRTLAENGRLDPIDSLTELKSQHDKGKKTHGLDVFTGKVVDSFSRGIIEPLKIKTQAIKSASEVAELILRIDDVLYAGSNDHQGPQNQGTPPMY